MPKAAADYTGLLTCTADGRVIPHNRARIERIIENLIALLDATEDTDTDICVDDLGEPDQDDHCLAGDDRGTFHHSRGRRDGPETRAAPRGTMGCGRIRVRSPSTCR
jgi:hypothetical protein